MQSFKAKLEKIKTERKVEAQQYLGPQQHSKRFNPMDPNRFSSFMLDEIKKKVNNTRND